MSESTAAPAAPVPEEDDAAKGRLVTVTRMNDADYQATDALGRTLLVRKLDEEEKADLYEAAEDVLSVRWMMMAETACTVRAINGVPTTFPDSKKVLRGRIKMLATEGMDVAAGIGRLLNEGRVRNRYEVAGENPVAAKN